MSADAGGQAALTRHGAEAAVLYAFDLLHLDGEDFREKPLEDRHAALGGLIRKGSVILMSEEYTGAGADLFRIACEHEFKRIVSKRLDRPNRSGRSKAWLKTKCVQSDTFVLIGYQPTLGAVRGALADIKIATLDGKTPRYAGAVGTGFSEAMAIMLRERQDALKTARCAVAGLKVRGAVWVESELRVEIAYRRLTTAGELRHASLKGLAE